MSTYTARVKVFEFTNSDVDNRYLVDEDGDVYKVMSTIIDGEDIVCRVRKTKDYDEDACYPTLDSIFVNKRKTKKLDV